MRTKVYDKNKEVAPWPVNFSLRNIKTSEILSYKF